MIKLSFEGASTSELHGSIAEYLDSVSKGGTPAAAAGKLKKVPEEGEEGEDPAPAKKAPAKKALEKVEDTEGKEADLSDAGLREAFKGTDQPVEVNKKILIKFGFPSIAEVPKKRRQELYDFLQEVGTWSAKKLNAYLEDEDL